MTDLAIPSLFASRAARITLVMSCLFGAMGVVLPYLSRWLAVERGLSGAEIGAVLSLAQLARIGTGPLIALWADRMEDRSKPLKLLAAAASLAYAAFFFLAHDFASVLAIGFIALTLTQGLVPFVEAATLRATAEGKISYGVSRGIGSVSFIVANVAGGALIARFGLGAVAVWVLSAYMLTALAAFGVLKPDHAPPVAASAARSSPRAPMMALLGNRRFLVLILSCGLIQAAHAFYYGFSTLVWRAQGVAPETIGWLWACGVAAEVAFLWSLPWIERQVRPETLILIGAGGAALRWLLLGFAPLGGVLWLLQAMHALSFAAAHVGAMRLLYREASQYSAGLAQTLYAALAGGLLLGLATMASGVLYDEVGARGYWLMAAMAALGGTLALGLRAPRPSSGKV